MVTGVYMDKRGREEWRDKVEEGMGYICITTYQQMKVLLNRSLKTFLPLEQCRSLTFGGGGGGEREKAAL